MHVWVQQVLDWHVMNLDWTLFWEPTVVARPILRGIRVNGAGALLHYQVSHAR